MFLPTMNNAEIYKEARKDFFELSTKVSMAIDRYNHKYCNLANNSPIRINDMPATMISRSVEKRQWPTRRNNTWTSYFRFRNEIAGNQMTMECYLYTAIRRTSGTEYIFLGDFNTPLAERFTLHFIERYKERHLNPRNIDLGAMPAPLYFQLHNPNCIMGRYYKATDLDIKEGAHHKFWIAPEGIYVTDYIDGMLTYINFMDKEGLSPLKKQIYEEEIVWDMMLRIKNTELDDDERSMAVFSIANNPDWCRIFERFIKRNAEDGDEKQELLKYVRERMGNMNKTIQEAKAIGMQREKDLLRKNRLTNASNLEGLRDEIEIKEYDINRIKNMGK